MLKTYLLVIAVIQLANSIKFNFTLDRKDFRCFLDTLNRNIMVVGQVTSESQEYSLKIIAPQQRFDNLIHLSNYSADTRFSFVTNFSQTSYQFCINNLGTSKTSFFFEYDSGAEAQMAQKQDLQNVQYEIKKIKNILNSVKQDQSSYNEDQRSRISLVTDISYKVIYFSLFTMGFMVLMNLFQMQRLKKFFRQKKII